MEVYAYLFIGGIMRRRIRVKKKIYIGRLLTSHKIIVTIILFLIVLCFSFKWIHKKAFPLFSTFGEMETTKLANIIINKAISKQLVENASIEDMFIITRDSNDEIKTIDFNPVIVNKFLSTTTSSIQLSLKSIEEGNVDFLELPDDVLIDYDKEKLKRGIIYEIPSGVIFGNSFLSNLGPKIPVRFHLMGDISSNVGTKITNYGINNAMIEVNLNINLTVMSILPFISKKVKINNSVPLSIKMVEGNIPNYYFNGLGRETTTFSLPTS